MPRRRGRVRDKWRMKDWYNVYSPPYFGEVLIGSVPCNEPDKMLERGIEASLYDLTGDFSQQHIKLFFKVINVNEKNCSTIFNGHEYSRDYIRSLVRRGSSRADSFIDLTTKDAYKLRLSIVMFTVLRIVTSKLSALRRISQSIVEEKATDLNFDQLVQEIVLGKVASDIYNNAKKIAPLRHVGIRKTKLLYYPKERQPEMIKVEPSGS